MGFYFELMADDSVDQTYEAFVERVDRAVDADNDYERHPEDERRVMIDAGGLYSMPDAESFAAGDRGNIRISWAVVSKMLEHRELFSGVISVYSHFARQLDALLTHEVLDGPMTQENFMVVVQEMRKGKEWAAKWFGDHFDRDA